MDLKTGIEDMRKSRSFRYVLAVLLTVGNFLNGAQVGTSYFLINFSLLSYTAGSKFNKVSFLSCRPTA